jgi:pimeloyl-ACP methyl ester carboxylesterase
VLALAPAAELRLLYEQGQCDNAAARLMGGSPESLPARYAVASPADLAPLGVPIEVVLGRHDKTWTPVGRAYVQAAQAAGEQQIKVTNAQASGHFEMINPATTTWPLVLDALARLLDSRL